MDKNKLIENLKKICLDTKPLTPNFFKERKFSKMWMRKEISVFLNQEDLKPYYDILKEIVLDPNIAQNFSLKDIENQVQEVISNVLKLATNELKTNKITEEVDNLIKNLESKIEDWIFILPIENLKLIRRTINIGDVKLFTFTKNQYSKHLKNYKLILNNNEHYKNNKKFKDDAINNFKKYFLNNLINWTCAEVKVKGTNEGAKQVAIKKTDLALSAIKLYNYSNDDFYKRYFGIKGEIIPPNNRQIISLKVNQHHLNTSLEKIGYMYPFELDKQRLKFMFKNGFKKLALLYNKKKKTDLDQRIINSVYWYSKAFDVPEVKKVDDGKVKTQPTEEVEYFNLGDKFLKLTIALECLLIFGKENKAYNLKTRSSYLLEDRKEQRIELQKYMQKAYETRSSIVHEGGYGVSKKETNAFMNYVQSVIIVLIKFKERWRLKTNEDLYQWFEKNRLNDRL